MEKIGGNVKIKKVAVTGRIASGKSTVCRLLQNLGACTVSADEIAHRLLNPQSTAYNPIIQLLGPEIVTRGEIDRRKIAHKVFKDPALLKKLQDILHPRIFEEIKAAYAECCRMKNRSLFVAEVPLLYETGFDAFFDAVIVVEADLEICRKRFVDATGNDTDEFAHRTKLQLAPHEKMARAEHVIMNSGTLEELKLEVEALFHLLTAS